MQINMSNKVYVTDSQGTDIAAVWTFFAYLIQRKSTFFNLKSYFK